MVKRAMVAEETFQSTLSMRRATSAPAAAPAAVAETFQSTLSMRRATSTRSWHRSPPSYFNPRSP